MKRFLLMGFSACLLASCATYPLPLIDNGIYTNPEYLFSIELPAGWEYDDEPPDWAKNRLPHQQMRGIVVSLSNRKTTGFILISGAKFHYDIDTAEERDDIKAALARNSRQQETAAANNPSKSYTYKLHDFRTGVEPQLILNELIITENDFLKLVIHGSSYLYLCETDHTCGLDIVLISDAGTFNDNNIVYGKLLDSLSGGRQVP